MEKVRNKLIPMQRFRKNATRINRFNTILQLEELFNNPEKKYIP